jgi:hydroxyacylglutathione hydrolase
MYDSLFTKITKLDDNLIVYPGHNYGPSSWSTIGEEKKWNSVLQHRTKEEFLDYMRSP